MMAPTRQTRPAYWNIPAYGSSDHVAKGSSPMRMLRKTKDNRHKTNPRISKMRASMRFARILLISTCVFNELLHFVDVFFCPFFPCESAFGERPEDVRKDVVKCSFHFRGHIFEYWKRSQSIEYEIGGCIKERLHPRN